MHRNATTRGRTPLTTKAAPQAHGIPFSQRLGVRGCGLLLLLASWSCPAQIATDGTVGPQLDLAGPDFRIGAELGSTRGANLFHSFRSFGIRGGESATFTGPNGIANVVSRVTGGAASSIDGRLRSEVGTADFFFLNPAGVVFGPNAQVDVPAAFHVSTADELRFADGNVYSASDPERSTLTMATPESFGFLSPRPASIEVNGSTLEFTPGRAVSLSADDVRIAGNGVAASLRAEGGEIRIDAVGERGGEVPLADAARPPGNGILHIEHARIDASGDGGGRLIVRAGRATLIEATLAADNLGDTDATRGIDLAVAGSLEILAGRVQSNALSMGDAGSITVQAGELRIEGGDTGTLISSGTLAGGHAGNVTIQAEELRIDGGDTSAGILSAAGFGSTGDAGNIAVTVGFLEMLGGGAIGSNTASMGNAGSIAVRAGTLRIDGQGTGAGISSGALPNLTGYADSTGHAGNVEVVVDGLVELLEGGFVDSSTSAVGDAGSVLVQAGELRIDGQGTGAGISSGAFAGSTGHAGNIEVVVDGLVELLEGGFVDSSTFAVGDAGSVAVRAGELRIDGRGNPDSFTGIASNAGTGSGGRAGSVEVVVDGLGELLEGGFVDSSTFAAGDAGSVAVRAGELRIDGGGTPDQFTGIASQAHPDSGGLVGNIEVSANTVEIGNGGAISIAARQTVSQDRLESFVPGEIVIAAGRIVLRGSGEIGAESLGNVPASNIAIDTEVLRTVAGGAITTAAAVSDGGDIRITAGERIDLDRGELSTEATGGRGGSITLDAPLLEAGEGSRISASVLGGNGAGGSLVFAGERLILTGGSRFESSTGGSGRGGDIAIAAAESFGAEGMSAGVGSGLYSLASSEGAAGTIEVTSPWVGLADGAQISTSSSGSGRAGDVRLVESLRTLSLTPHSAPLCLQYLAQE